MIGAWVSSGRRRLGLPCVPTTMDPRYDGLANRRTQPREPLS